MQLSPKFSKGFWFSNMVIFALFSQNEGPCPYQLKKALSI